jgi:hypothetical protein
MGPMIDARRFFRRRVDLPATVAVRESAPEVCRIENLSIDGAYLVLHRLESTAPLRVRFRLPGSREPLDLPATVSWSDERGAGVHFDRMRPELAWKLGRFLASSDGD